MPLTDGRCATPVTRVIFIVEYPFNDRDWDRFGIRTLQDAGFEVEIWDVTSVTHREILEGLRVTLTAQGFAHRTFHRAIDVTLALRGLDRHSFLMAVVTYAARSLFLFKALKRTELRFGLLAGNAMLSGSTGARDIMARIRVLTPTSVFRSVFHRIPPRIWGVAPAEVAFTATAFALEHCIPVDRRTQRVVVHAFDYDVFLRARARVGIGDDRCAVFLDEYLPLHPDWAKNGEAPASPEVYYPRLRAFFELIQERTGLRVIIAAHPRSRYDHTPFGDREVIYGRTAELVCRAGLVLAQASQSVGFAAMAEKPVAFLTMDAFLRSDHRNAADYGRLVGRLASSFGKVPFNIDRADSVDLGDVMQVDHEAYAAFRAKYIKEPGSPDRPYWEIVSSYLKKPAC